VNSDWTATRRQCLATLLAGPSGWPLASAQAGAQPVAQPGARTGPTRGSIAWPALVTISGQPIPAESWRGVPAVIVFWATYCAFCKRHNAHVDRLYRQVDPDQLRILGVVLDVDAAAARRYMRTQGYAFPVVVDDGRLRRQFTERRVIPMTCTVSAEGQLLQCVPGEMAPEDVLGLARLART